MHYKLSISSYSVKKWFWKCNASPKSRTYNSVSLKVEICRRAADPVGHTLFLLDFLNFVLGWWQNSKTWFIGKGLLFKDRGVGPGLTYWRWRQLMALTRSKSTSRSTSCVAIVKTTNETTSLPHNTKGTSRRICWLQNARPFWWNGTGNPIKVKFCIFIYYIIF